MWTATSDAVERFFAARNIAVHPSGLLSSLSENEQSAARIVRGGSIGEYRVVWVRKMTLAAVSRLGDHAQPLLVLGDQVSERSAEAFRLAQIDYLDAAGNAHIQFGDVYVDIRGRKRAIPAPEVFDTPNLFSARRMQVIFVLLVWPETARYSVREVARAAGTSVGLTQSTIRGLASAGYLVGENLHRRDDLVNIWAAAYSGSLLPKLRLGSFFGEFTQGIQVRDGFPPLLVSGEGAVPGELTPETLTLYTEELDPRLPILNRWRTDREPNIEIRRRFWREPDLQIAPHDDYRRASAPQLLVYADLLASGDPRQMNVAAGMRERGEL